MTKFAESELSITRRRGRRSATTPPTSNVEICASVQHANEIPTSVADPVRSRTANATAIGARFVPKNEIVRAAKRSRKFRCLSAPTPLTVSLLRVAFQACVRLPERHRTLVLGCRHRIVVRQLVERARRELVFRRTSVHALGPFVESPPELVQMRPGVVRDPEVDQRERLRLAPLELVERAVPGLDVDLRWRSRRHYEAMRLDPDAGGVAAVRRPVAADVHDVVGGVAGGGEAVES